MSEHGVACPTCGTRGTRCIDSRPVGDTVRRRRACNRCEARFSTYEIDQPTFDLLNAIQTGEFQRRLNEPMQQMLDALRPFGPREDM